MFVAMCCPAPSALGCRVDLFTLQVGGCSPIVAGSSGGLSGPAVTTEPTETTTRRRFKLSEFSLCSPISDQTAELVRLVSFNQT